MVHIKKNDLLIGFTISVLLSLLVNSPLLMRNYKGMSADLPVPVEFTFDNFIFYFIFIWFFLYSLVLYLISSEAYHIGDKLFRKKEYKVILFAGAVSISVAIAVFQLYPVVHDRVIIEFYPENAIVTLSTKSVSVDHGTYMVKSEGPKQEFSFTVVPDHPVPFPRTFMIEHLVILLTILLIVQLIRLLNGKQQMVLEYEKLKTEKLQTSYNALMGQINPHFFFNSLNGLNSLIRNGEKEQTLTYLDELSNVFRYILQSNKKEMVTLAEELQFVKAYTYLLGVRYEGKLFFSIQADPPLLLWYLPILSVLPLIENAVKHNVISKQYPLQIDIYTTKEYQLVVSNKIQPKIEEGNSSGIGLKNLWGRYRMLTGKDICISNRKEYFKVSLPLLNHPVQS